MYFPNEPRRRLTPIKLLLSFKNLLASTGRGETCPKRVGNSSPRPVHPNLQRLLWFVPLLLLGLEVLWVLGVNFLLKTDGAVFGWVNLKPEKFRMDWVRAFSYWPGDLRMTGVRIRGNNLTTQWMVSMDRARTQVGLGALLDKRFLGQRLRAEGVVFHLRRLPYAEARLKTEEVVAPIPWSDFLSRPSDAEVREILAAQIRPPKNKIWAVDLREAEAGNVREIWIDEFRYRGGGSAQGSLLLRPRQKLNLEAFRTVVGPGIVTLGIDQVLRVRSGRLSLGFPEVNTALYRGGAVLQKLEAQILIDGNVPDIRFAKFYRDRFAEFEISGTPGDLSVDCSASQGVLHGNVTLRGDAVHGTYRNAAWRGDLRIDGIIKRWVLGQGEIDISGTHGSMINVAIDKAGESRRLAQNWSGDATFQQGTLRLGESNKLEASVVGKIQDSRPLLELFPAHKELPWLLKSILSERNLDASASIRAGRDLVEVRALEVNGEKLRLQARLRMEQGFRPHGILYVKRGVISIGLETGGDRSVKLVKAKEWFEHHPLLRPPDGGD